MTDAELDRLAALIAAALRSEIARPTDALARTASPRAASSRPSFDVTATTWLPVPVRPELAARPSEPPVWSGASQQLESSTERGGSGSRFRAPIGETAAALSAAAAGKGAPVETARTGRVVFAGRARPSNAKPFDVRIGVSNRHLHLSPAHVRALFGKAETTSARPLNQPGQYAASETVDVVGPKGRIDRVRIVGPARGETQLEIAASDARMLGVDPPLAASGSLAGSIGGVTLVGPAGSVALTAGVIIAARHLHLGVDDGRALGLRDGDRLDVRCGAGARSTTFHDVLVRAGSGHRTELHLDGDEAYAAGVRSGDTATVLAWRGGGSSARRPLVTEREVQQLARAGRPLPAGALLTPSARDRAVALGLIPR